MQETSAWPNGVEFDFNNSFTVYREVGCPASVVVPTALAVRVSSWDSKRISAWISIDSEITILSVYLPDGRKPDEDFLSALIFYKIL